MSRLWANIAGVEAVRVATVGLAGAAANDVFAPWDGVERRTGPAAAPFVVPAPDIEALSAAAFAEGREQGMRDAVEALAAERAALAMLAAGLEQCRSEPPEALAAVLHEVVGRLVGQVVGEIEINQALIRDRVDAVAKLIVDQAGPVRMRLNPEDVARLADGSYDFPLVADPGLMPGSVIVETASGWVENGAEVGMERLRLALDQMAVVR